MKRLKHSEHFGFTLIELLVIILIIGILAAVILPNFMNVRERARDSKRKRDLDSVKTALRLYYNDKQSYPENSANGEINGCGAVGTSTCSWGGAFAAGSTTYMQRLPVDPINSGVYKYTYSGGNEKFYIMAILENKSDSDITQSQQECSISSPPSGGYYTCVGTESGGGIEPPPTEVPI